MEFPKQSPSDLLDWVPSIRQGTGILAVCCGALGKEQVLAGRKEVLNLANPEHLLNQRSCDRTPFACTFQYFITAHWCLILSRRPRRWREGGARSFIISPTELTKLSRERMEGLFLFQGLPSFSPQLSHSGEILARCQPKRQSRCLERLERNPLSLDPTLN